MKLLIKILNIEYVLYCTFLFIFITNLGLTNLSLILNYNKQSQNDIPAQNSRYYVRAF